MGIFSTEEVSDAKLAAFCYHKYLTRGSHDLPDEGSSTYEDSTRDGSRADALSVNKASFANC